MNTMTRRRKVLQVLGHALSHRWVIVEPGVRLSESSCKCGKVWLSPTRVRSGNSYYQHLVEAASEMREDI